MQHHHAECGNEEMTDLRLKHFEGDE